jgi:hypothetical protein
VKGQPSDRPSHIRGQTACSFAFFYTMKFAADLRMCTDVSLETCIKNICHAMHVSGLQALDGRWGRRLGDGTVAAQRQSRCQRKRSNTLSALHGYGCRGGFPGNPSVLYHSNIGECDVFAEAAQNKRMCIYLSSSSPLPLRTPAVSN